MEEEEEEEEEEKEEEAPRLADKQKSILIVEILFLFKSI